MTTIRLAFLTLLIFTALPCSAQTATNNLPVITIKTDLPEDKEVSFPYRVPSSYDPKGKEIHRIFMNCVWQTTAFDSWADAHGFFIVHAKFKNRLCWKVKEGYGQAILDFLDKLKKEYRVSTDQLFVYGASRGGQLSNYFATWKPELITAWVAHIPGVLDKPHDGMKNIPGILTAGEGDDYRYQLAVRYMEEAHKLQLPIIWRSFANAGHEVPAQGIEMSKAFFAFHHERTKDLLQRGRSRFASSPDAALPKPLFVGDDQEWKYFPIDSEEARAIAPEHRVELPTEEVAKWWAEQETANEGTAEEPKDPN